MYCSVIVRYVLSSFTLLQQYINKFWGRRAHLSSNNVHEVWSWSSFNWRLCRPHVTSCHALGRRIISTLSTLWTRPHVMIDRCWSFNVVRHDSVRLRSVIENQWENTCINKFVMENEPLFWFQYQYAQKQGLNLSNSLG